MWTGIGLVLGYALLGVGWLTMKSDGELRAWARERIPGLAIAVLVALILAFDAAVFEQRRIGADLMDRLWGLVFPSLGLLAMAGVLPSPKICSSRSARSATCETARFSLTLIFSPETSLRPGPEGHARGRAQLAGAQCTGSLPR